MKNPFDIDSKKLSNLMSVAGVVTAVFVAFYATGLYRNILQIKKLKREENNQ